LLGGLERRLARRRVTGVAVLRIEGEPTLASLEEITEPDARLGAIGARRRISERRGIGAGEPEPPVVGPQRAGNETFAPARLHLEPGIGALPQGQVSGAELAVDVPFLVGVGGQAEPYVVAEPVVALAAGGERVQVAEPRRVLVPRHEQCLGAAQAAR